jgi:hypothetical protein
MLPSNRILTSTNKIYCSLGGAAEVVRHSKGTRSYGEFDQNNIFM